MRVALDIEPGLTQNTDADLQFKYLTVKISGYASLLKWCSLHISYVSTETLQGYLFSTACVNERQ
jgi:hypothetical protein